MLETIFTIVHVVLALVLILVVLLQNGKTAGLSGSIGGGAETFFGKNKARTIDGMLEKATAVLAILFIITSVVLAIVVK
jgi:preprotein translocase subunit SecG